MGLILSKVTSVMLYPMGVMSACLLLGLLAVVFARKRLARLFFSLGVVVFLVTSSPWVGQSMMRQLESQYPVLPMAEITNADVIVMLGGALALPIPPRKTAELVHSSDRILHTARLYRAAKAPRVFLSGGNVFAGFHDRGETFYIFNLLQEWGVPEQHIAFETDSRTTYQNALETKKYLQNNGLSNGRVLLVTSASHMPRSMAVYRKVGLNVTAAPTDIAVTEQSRPGIFYWLPSIGAMAMVTRAWHEILGLWVYRLRGWA